MNDALLSQRLRALRVPSPESGFEQRLRAALEEEARTLAASRPRVSSQERVRRWTGRAGLTLAVTLGASAAAAAASWMSRQPREDVGGSSRALPASASESPRRSVSQPSLLQPPRSEPSLSQPASPSEAARASAHEDLAAPRRRIVIAEPASSRAAQSRSSSERGTQRTQRAETVSARSPERPSRAAHEPPPRPLGSAALVPFELPGVSLSGGSPPAGAVNVERSSERRAPRAGRADVERPLPPLDRAPPERTERGKSEAVRERARTREPRGRENAERGLERAREVRDRNGK